MIDPGGKCHFGRLEGVVRGEVDGEEKDATLVGTFWWTHNSRLPMKQIITYWTRRTLCWRITTQIL